MGRYRIGFRGREARSTRSSLHDRSQSTSPSRCTQSSLRAILARLRSYRIYLLVGAILLVLLKLTWPRAGPGGTAHPEHPGELTPQWSSKGETSPSISLRLKGLDDASTSGLPTLAKRFTENLQQLEHGLQRLLKNRFLPSRDDLSKLLENLPPKQQTLRFKVCNGFANQRLSVVYGVLLAQRLGRTPVLPVLMRDGVQRSDATVLAHGANKVSFEDVYDLTFFLYELAKAGIRMLEPHEAPRPSAYTEVSLGALGANVSGALATTYGHLQHLSIDCPLFKMSPGEMNQRLDEPIIWAVLDALRPSHLPYLYVETMQNAIKHLGAVNGKPATRYNFLHLRLENDWVEHCKRWSNIPDGVVRDNCYNNTETIDVQLRLFAFSTNVPLYVASYWNDVEPERAKKVMGRLVDAGYRVITSNDVFPEAMKAEDREIRALVEYYVGFGASRGCGPPTTTVATSPWRHTCRCTSYRGCSHTTAGAANTTTC
ncbi:hypothetical protein Vafri_5079 [Volvox africanus]|uniref:O-fucosyltransferase family protein n=1 Tax=Volvox africanus TaxID=51714 RepID=A0A8J4AWQ8_9CHLO|nr:hypothetical protein Vafri_5079 [Volvox africanus]